MHKNPLISLSSILDRWTVIFSSFCQFVYLKIDVLVYILLQFCFVFQRKKERPEEAKLRRDIDRVETAFRKFDIDGDGFVDWEEFKEMTKNMEPEQAKRIFNSLDKVSHLMVCRASL